MAVSNLILYDIVFRCGQFTSVYNSERGLRLREGVFAPEMGLPRARRSETAGGQVPVKASNKLYSGAIPIIIRISQPVSSIIRRALGSGSVPTLCNENLSQRINREREKPLCSWLPRVALKPGRLDTMLGTDSLMKYQTTPSIRVPNLPTIRCFVRQDLLLRGPLGGELRTIGPFLLRNGVHGILARGHPQGLFTPKTRLC